MRQIDRRLRSVWNQMHQRCKNPNSERYPRYGARGVRVDPRWDSFSTFATWATETGYEPGLTVDRVDNDGPYSPENCRWLTPSQQQRNTSRSVLLTAFSETKSAPDWAEDPRCAVSYTALIQRVRVYGWPAEEANHDASATERWPPRSWISGSVPIRARPDEDPRLESAR